MQTLVQQSRALIGWALFLVMVAATLALGANRPVSWSFMALAIMGLFSLTLLVDMFDKRPRVYNRVWFPAVLFLGALTWGALQGTSGLLPADWAHPVWQLTPDAPSYVSADPAQGTHILMRLASYAMVFWIAIRSCQNKDTGLRYLKAFALFSMGLAGFGIYAANTGENVILGELASDTVSATFVNRNNYATFAGFGLVACLALLMRRARSGSASRNNPLVGLIEGLVSGGWLWIAGITLCGGALMLSQSRGGAGAALIGVLALLSTQRLRGGAATVGPVLIIGAIVAAIFVSASSGTVNRLVATDDESGRFAVFPAVVDGITDRAWLGHGIGAFETAFRAMVPVEAATGEWDKAHNSYLENAFELGLPAAAAFYLALLAIGWRLVRGVWERHRDRTLVSVAFACYLLGAFHALFDFSLQMPALAAFFVWIIGLGYAQAFSREDQRQA